MCHRVAFVAALLFALTFHSKAEPTESAAESAPMEEWRDPVFKSARIAAPMLKGEYYEAEAPDTLDLIERAEYSINALTRLLEPKYDYTQNSFVEFRADPPTLIMGHGGLTNLNPKWMESIGLMRLMSGSTTNIERDGRIVESLIHNTAPDGLTYQPVDHPGAFYDDFTREQGKPAADMFGEGRQLLALSVWTQLSSNPIFREIAERKIERLLEIAVPKGDALYYRLGRGYYPGQKDADKVEIYAITDHEVTKDNVGMVGTAAYHTVGTAAMGAARYYLVTGHEPALKLARGMANYIRNEAKVIDEDGRWHGWHFHIVAAGLLGALEYAAAANDREMLEWSRRAYEYGKVIGDPILGFYAGIPGCGECEYNPAAEECGKDHARDFSEPCSISDMMMIALKLTRAGMGDYYEDVEYAMRNLFLEQQVIDLGFLEDFPQEISDKIDLKPTAPDPLQMSTGNAAERGVGSWVCSTVGQWYLGQPGPQACSCCLGNGARALYYVWDSIMDSAGEDLRVNILMNRASAWADLDSYLPYEGKVVLKMKQAKNVHVRIPSWTKDGEVSCAVNGESRPFEWEGRYVNVGSTQPGDVVSVEFPMREETLWRPIKSVVYKTQLRGFTVVALEPKPKITPLFNRDQYKQDKTPTHKVVRFASAKELVW